LKARRPEDVRSAAAYFDRPCQKRNEAAYEQVNVVSEDEVDDLVAQVNAFGAWVEEEVAAFGAWVDAELHPRGPDTAEGWLRCQNACGIGILRTPRVKTRLQSARHTPPRSLNPFRYGRSMCCFAPSRGTRRLVRRARVRRDLSSRSVGACLRRWEAHF
jgi:hypothetical protein